MEKTTQSTTTNKKNEPDFIKKEIFHIKNVYKSCVILVRDGKIFWKLLKMKYYQMVHQRIHTDGY